jgi:hypothetical protein
MQQQSKDAYPDGNSVPTHAPCNKLHQVRSVEQLAHKDRRCITIHQRMPLPILGKSATL